MYDHDEVWVVDDDGSIRWVLDKALTAAGYRVRLYENAESVIKSLARTRPLVLISDIRMPGKSGLDLLEHIQTNGVDLPVIITTAHTDLDSAVNSYQGGAFEYLPKPFDIDEAVSLVGRAVEQFQSVDVTDSAEIDHSTIIGEAPAMQELFRAIGRLSTSNMNVLIVGESGTGKELVARALYENSPRRQQSFIAINTAAIPSELLESELFGHEKGAFTGAHGLRKGRFEQADGGTLFLDEIGDMPAALQTRLLRVLADGKFYRVGGHEEIHTDVRIIAATNQNLERRVEQGEFREDLYHRLNVIRINLPSLRQRKEDIELLIQWFLKRAASELSVDMKVLLPDALQRMNDYHWPGNVRQLENVCRWMTVMAPGKTIGLADLPPELKENAGEAQLADWESQLKQLVNQKLLKGENQILGQLGRRFETVLLQAALIHTHGRKQEAARRLGWGRNTLTRKLKELGLPDAMR